MDVNLTTTFKVTSKQTDQPCEFHDSTIKTITGELTIGFPGSDETLHFRANIVFSDDSIQCPYTGYNNVSIISVGNSLHEAKTFCGVRMVGHPTPHRGILKDLVLSIIDEHFPNDTKPDDVKSFESTHTISVENLNKSYDYPMVLVKAKDSCIAVTARIKTCEEYGHSESEGCIQDTLPDLETREEKLFVGQCLQTLFDVPFEEAHPE